MLYSSAFLSFRSELIKFDPDSMYISLSALVSYHIFCKLNFREYDRYYIFLVMLILPFDCAQIMSPTRCNMLES